MRWVGAAGGGKTSRGRRVIKTGNEHVGGALAGGDGPFQNQAEEVRLKVRGYERTAAATISRRPA